MPITETIKNLSYSTLAIRKVFYRIDRCILDKPCSVPLYSNGGQPCTPVVIIYLQVHLSLFRFKFPNQGCPYHCLGCSLMGFTRSTRNVSIPVTSLRSEEHTS